MTAGSSDDYWKMTFSQREGMVPLPESMELETIPKRFRQLTWFGIEIFMREICARLE